MNQDSEEELEDSDDSDNNFIDNSAHVGETEDISDSDSEQVVFCS